MNRLLLGVGAVVIPFSITTGILAGAAFVAHGHSKQCAQRRAEIVAARAAAERAAAVTVQAPARRAVTAQRAQRTQPPRPIPVREGTTTIREDAPTLAVRATAAELESLWRGGRRGVANDLVAARPEVLALDETGEVAVACAFRERHRGTGRAELVVERRPGSMGPIAVAIPPGTYGSSTSRQDLVFLRGGVIVLGTDEQRARIDLPVACGNYGRDNPTDRFSYALRRFEPDSTMDRLAAELCEGEGAPEAEAQLAIWIARNGISRGRLQREGGGITFDSGVPVRLSHADGAARILRDAGLDPSETRFFTEPLPVQPARVRTIPGDLRIMMGADEG